MSRGDSHLMFVMLFLYCLLAHHIYVLFMNMVIYVIISQIIELCLFLNLQMFKADITCPSFFSPSVKSLIERILDPNPATVST